MYPAAWRRCARHNAKTRVAQCVMCWAAQRSRRQEQRASIDVYVQGDDDTAKEMWASRSADVERVKCGLQTCGPAHAC